MFKSTRRKIVVSIMSILVIVWICSLSVIFVSSYSEMSGRNREMLTAHGEMYELHESIQTPPPLNRPLPEGGKHRFEQEFTDSPMFRLSRFYSVAISYDGTILEIRNDSSTVHTDEELVDLAQSILKGKKEYGIENNFSFYKMDKNGYFLVVFMDNTIINENAMTLLRFTFVFGGVVIVFFFFLSVYLARKIVQPLEESYQKQKQFISDAGHELKTPVSVVNANAELLSREIGTNQWLLNIQYENERMGVLVSQLLELARTENVRPQMECVQFSHLVAGEVLPFESVAFERGMVLNSNISKDILIEGNSIQLKQLVSILIDNALRHTVQKDEIFVRLNKERGYAVLSVINKGEEIPKEQRERIFERFYRVDNARNSEDNHYGLGLAIAKAIVNMHKGKIKVECYDGLVEFNIKIPILKN